MSKIKIETITNVHIGSGELLSQNNDFCLAVDSEGYDVIGIIDPRKVMKLVGVEHIDSWVAAIERKRPIGDFVHQYAPKATVEDYSSRIVERFSGRATETLKECIHDGLGRPYIPGSSIKGAIRTAVLATLAAELPSERLDILARNGKPSASVMEKKLFGDTPNADIFRFLHVGDAIFGDLLTSAVNMVNVNEREKHSFWDESKSQTIEALSIGDETTFLMRLKLDSYRNSSDAVGQLPKCMMSMPQLFDAINAHTLSLLGSEIDYWMEMKDADATNKVDAYIAECKKVKSEAEKCLSGQSCILRIGHGSGWRFITGAWSERSSLFYDKVVPAARPNNAKKYADYDFPKSRRVCKGCRNSPIDDCCLLGFVKLTLQDE